MANYMEKTLVLESLFNKVAGLKVCNFIKRHSDTGVFLWNSQEHLSLRNSSGRCFYPFIYGCISTFCWICFMLNWFLGAEFCNTSTLACINVVSLNIEKPEVFARMCSVKKVFLKFWQNSQENTCLGVSF